MFTHAHADTHFFLFCLFMYFFNYNQKLGSGISQIEFLTFLPSFFFIFFFAMVNTNLLFSSLHGRCEKSFQRMFCFIFVSFFSFSFYSSYIHWNRRGECCRTLHLLRGWPSELSLHYRSVPPVLYLWKQPCRVLLSFCLFLFAVGVVRLVFCLYASIFPCLYVDSIARADWIGCLRLHWPPSIGHGGREDQTSLINCWPTTNSVQGPCSLPSTVTYIHTHTYTHTQHAETSQYTLNC